MALALGLIHAALGNEDQAFIWLEKALEEHSEDLHYLGVDPRFDSLRSDPRFGHLLQRLYLAP